MKNSKQEVPKCKKCKFIVPFGRKSSRYGIPESKEYDCMQFCTLCRVARGNDTMCGDKGIHFSSSKIKEKPIFDRQQWDLM